MNIPSPLLALFALSPCLFAQGTQHAAYVKASNTAAGDSFGDSVDVSGDTLVVGASFQGAGSGAVYVFVRSAGSWSQQAFLKASNVQSNDRFGCAVAVDGDTIVVGAKREDSGSPGVNGDQADNSTPAAGAAYVFVRSGTTWKQQAYLKASNPDNGIGSDEFGYAVDLSGDTIVVGAHQEDSAAIGIDGDAFNDNESNSGAAYVFVRSGTNWTQQAYVKPANTQSGYRFGCSVSIDDDTMVVGAWGEDSESTGIDGDPFNHLAPNAGAAYVFVRSGSSWSQEAYLKASNTAGNDQFGADVSLSDDTIVVGARFEASNAKGVNGDQASNTGAYSGAAYVFVRNGTTWSQQAYLKASNSDLWDTFGDSVSVSGDTIVVGATGEDSSAIGIDGNQSNNSLNMAGAAYVYWRTGAAWSHQSYVKASNTGVGDAFGLHVAASNETFVVATPFEDSSATGVDGNQNDDLASSAGAAYVLSFEEPEYSSYCFGDGSLATACPCALPDTVPAPPAATGHGCANSLNPAGALLSASGTTSPDTLRIIAHVAPVYVGFALLLKGNLSESNGVASSDGIRCVDGALLRFGGHFAGTNGDPVGQWSYPNAAQTTSISTATLQPPAQSAYYQLFYRNAAVNFCTAATANWLSALVVPWP